ncbi:uncharacterized protein LOC116056535 isoform X4 [Sander lucioperca]|uniref:uncharacterized protein LOC116056535 isoform X4 n=1 Tax=Sander lucioperca TaxID=283035 RepID=UPI00125E7D5A|nr:uncharacterized protein LOC116056535 isoform X4 [Sander lucioperca]
MLFVRAVWNENGKEMEGTIPDAWVNVAEKTLRWPKTRAKYCFDNHVAPKEDWETFPLLKVKITSESFHECEDYDQTSHAELCEEDEDEEVVVKKRMKKTKQFDDFVEGSDLSEATAEEDDKEKRKGDSSPIIPVFPTPPIKLKNVGVDRSNSGSPRSAGRDRSTGRTARSAGRDRSTSRSPRSAGRDRSTSRSPRSAGRDRTTSRTPRSLDRDRSTSVLGSTDSSRSRSRSVGRDSSISCSSRSVGWDNSSSRVHRSQAVEGLSHEMSSYNRDVPTTFPLSEAKFQKIVLTKLVTLTDEVKQLQRSMPKSSIEIIKINTLEEFEREEASLLDKNKFETLVCQLARVGGKDVKDCTHKVMDRLFTNNLMTLFNLKGKGKKDKIGLEDKKLFSAIKAAVMKWDAAATEAQIKSAASDHLKHAPGRVGGGGYK